MSGSGRCLVRMAAAGMYAIFVIQLGARHSSVWDVWRHKLVRGLFVTDNSPCACVRACVRVCVCVWGGEVGFQIKRTCLQEKRLWTVPD